MSPENRIGELHFRIDRLHVRGHGAILLTGPSSCGKGEIASALCRLLSLPAEQHVSMGGLLREAIARARADEAFRRHLAQIHGISDRVSVFDQTANRSEIVDKAAAHREQFERRFAHASQLDWLEFCVSHGLLLPDEWSQQVINAAFHGNANLRQGILLLDGYPRTVSAAEHVLALFGELDIPIVKVLHLSITKQEMTRRALDRGRSDDTVEGLERRYQFYVEKVQPCIDHLKHRLGAQVVSLIDAHQPVYSADRSLDVPASIRAVTLAVLQALGLPGALLDQGAGAK